MPVPVQYQTDKSYPTATIPAGQTESEVVDLGGTELAGVFVPPTFDGTTLSLKAAPTAAGTFVAVQSGGSDYSITTAASKYAPVENLALTAGLQFVKLVAGTAQSTTDTILTLAVRPV